MKKVKKLKRRLKKEGREFAYLVFFKILYLSGLTFLVPFVLALDLPEEIGIWGGTQEALLVISVFLIGFSFYGIYTRHKNSLPKTLRAMGWMTLIPGAFSLLLTFFGAPLLTLMAQSAALDNALIQTFVERTLGRVWYLTMSYILLGLSLYYLSKKMK